MNSELVIQTQIDFFKINTTHLDEEEGREEERTCQNKAGDLGMREIGEREVEEVSFLPVALSLLRCGRAKAIRESTSLFRV